MIRRNSCSVIFRPFLCRIGFNCGVACILYTLAYKVKRFLMQSRIKSRLLLACKQLGIDKPKDFQAATGFPYRTAQSYLNGTRTPNADGLAEICTRLRINLNWLLTGEGVFFVDNAVSVGLPEITPSGLNAEEQELLALFRQSSELGRAVIMSAARGAEKKEAASAAGEVA